MRKLFSNITHSISVVSRTYSLIQAYLKSGNESVKKYLATVEWEAANNQITLSRAVASSSPDMVESLLRNGVRLS